MYMGGKTKSNNKQRYSIQNIKNYVILWSTSDSERLKYKARKLRMYIEGYEKKSGCTWNTLVDTFIQLLNMK